jgi:hypothetical protein
VVGCHFSAYKNDLCVISSNDLNDLCVVVLVEGFKNKRKKMRTLPAYVVAWKTVGLLNLFLFWTCTQGKPQWNGCCSLLNL